MSTNRRIQLGLCCLNTTLRAEKPSVYTSRTITMKIIDKMGIEEVKRRGLANAEDLSKLIEWNERHGIKVLRVSSEIFPHYANPKVVDYDLEFAREALERAGALARKYNMRITFHPGQYNVVCAPNETVFENTIRDLSYQAEVLDMMGMGPDSVMVVHGGGLYGDKERAKDRWCVNFKRLPESVQRRLVLECCEKVFSIEDTLDISRRVGVPVVFDTHHFDCYKLLHPEVAFKPAAYYIPLVLETWARRGIKPKFHVSEQGSGRVGHHSDYIETIPDYLLEIPDRYDIDIDIMIEAKKKELAIFKLYEKYPQLNCKRGKLKLKPKMTKTIKNT